MQVLSCVGFVSDLTMERCFVSLVCVQLYEMSDDVKRKEFLDELFTFMQKRGKSAVDTIVLFQNIFICFSLNDYKYGLENGKTRDLHRLFRQSLVYSFLCFAIQSNPIYCKLFRCFSYLRL